MEIFKKIGLILVLLLMVSMNHAVSLAVHNNNKHLAIGGKTSITSTNPQAAAATFVKKTLTLGTLERHYYLYTPASVVKNTAKQSYPLLLAFHGGGGTPLQFAKSTGFNQLADQKKYVIAYPEGINHHWNDGRDGRNLPPQDDVAFVNAIIEEVAKITPLNRRKLYAAGMSNGGFMTQSLACQLSDKIKGFASVSATLPQDILASCTSKKPINFLMINGEADLIVPWKGGVMYNGGHILSVPSTINFWLKVNENNKPATMTQKLGTTLPDDGTQAVQSSYLQTQPVPSKVILISIAGGGHTWPRKKTSLVGKSSNKVDASQVIIDFFDSL